MSGLAFPGSFARIAVRPIPPHAGLARRWIARARFAPLLVAAALLVAARARAQDAPETRGEKLVNAQMLRERLAGRPQRLHVSAGPDPDTVFVGKSFTDHTGPQNYWNLYVGTYRPGTNNPSNALWDWDNTVGMQAPDSLQGWWPYTRQYNLTGGLTMTDDQRPWWAVEHGNIGNYVIAQGGAAGRTFGVVGYWHSDQGRNAGQGVTWSPISGSRSAWCGVREHGDVSHVDAVTGNPYNQDALALYGEGAGGTGTDAGFPGYPGQMDQMLYRDVAMAPGQSLTLTFNYRTRLSTSITTLAATRTGWFDKDPLAVTSGNFISSSAAGTNAPCDSFMVYVGSPVNDAACKLSDGTTQPVYDHLRRWFSEVLRVNEGGSAPYYELLSRTGNNPADTSSAASFSVTVPSATINTILGTAGNPGTVRLVFRVHTNRGFDDADNRVNHFSSQSRGAAILDDVTVNTGGGPSVIGDFEGAEESGANSIDNRDTPFTTALTNWKSTGKPPATWFHVENLANLTYNDLCGPPNSPARACNIGGVVMTAGNHDDNQDIADGRHAVWREAMYAFASPTINLVTDTSVANTPNPQGITSTIKHVTDDYWLWYDMYAGSFNLSFTGEFWQFGVQAYPAQQTSNGVRCWGERQYSISIFNPEPQCFTDLEQLFGNGLVTTSNASGYPDSLRLLLSVSQECFRFGVSLGCNSNAGAYFDNVSMAFVDIPAASQASASNTVVLGPVTVSLPEFWNDTFPANETAGLPGTAAFDTTAALIDSGHNIAGFTTSELRFDIPGDTTVAIAGNATTGTGDDPAYRNVRVDLVFRILPGPGNYQIAAGRSMPPGGVPTGTLLQLPTNQAATVSPGDASFWGQYIANAGEVTDNANSHHGHASWDPLTWNSARCDTAELNIFPTGLLGFTVQSPAPGLWASMYHESDPKFPTLGINKFKCFMLDTTKFASANPSNVVCDGTVPAWLTAVPRSHTGWDGTNTTKEFTKIIPDGLLTPGSHVEYFYRKSHAVDPFFEFAMCPDTTLITPQNGEGSTDGHRWQQFGVEPDRWKDAAFGGAGMACMLYVDDDDRRGDERVFVSVMDSIGGTAAAKFGAHNGWHASGAQNINGTPDHATFVSNRNSQPGTTWDMYGVKGAESFTTNAGSIGSRLANRSNMGLAAGRYSRQGPTQEMLRTYYRVVALLSGDLNSGVLGPLTNRSQNDIAILTDFLTTAGGSAQPRGIFVQGDGFAQSENWSAGVDPAHGTFLTDELGLIFRNLSYQSISGNTNACADLLTTTQVTGRADVYGVENSCQWSNDVFQHNPATPEAVDGSFYGNVGPNGPYVAEVLKPAVPVRNWVAFTSGYDIRHLLSRYCDTDNGRLAWYYSMLNQVFGGICALTGTPVVTLDTPGTPHSAPFTDFMKIGNSVMRQGVSSVVVSFAKPGFANVGVYDVTGRRVRTLAARQFPAGPSTLRWDGADDGGRRVARGVYFVRTNLTHDTGRIIVLND